MKRLGIILGTIGLIGYFFTGYYLNLIEPHPFWRMSLEEAQGWQLANNIFAFLLFVLGILFLVYHLGVSLKD